MAIDGRFELKSLQQGLTFTLSIIAIDGSLERSLPKKIDIQMPQVGADLTGINFMVLLARSLSLAGSIHYEGQTTKAQYRGLYREKPNIKVSLSLLESGIQTVIDLTESHLFEFGDLKRGADYELIVTSWKRPWHSVEKVSVPKL